MFYRIANRAELQKKAVCFCRQLSSFLDYRLFETHNIFSAKAFSL